MSYNITISTTFYFSTFYNYSLFNYNLKFYILTTIIYIHLVITLQV